MGARYNQLRRLAVSANASSAYIHPAILDDFPLVEKPLTDVRV